MHAVAITPRHACYVIDDALREPEHWVVLADEHLDRFEDSERNAFPGPELGFAPAALEKIEAFFNTHARAPLGGRRTLRCTARMSLTTRPPSELQPWQWMCHTDRMGVEPSQMVAAAVLYLFHDTALGGTSFYAPCKPLAEIADLIQASRALPGEEFSSRYGIPSGYMTDSNAWFRKLVSIAPRWNRMIFYPGTIFHSGDIRHPELLVADPRRGRLTVNAFFTCTRRAAS